MDLTLPTIGALDHFHNRHNHTKHFLQLADMSDASIARVGTYHSVTGPVQRAIHARILRSKDALAQAQQMALMTLRQYYFHFATMWHCQPDVKGVRGTHEISRTAGLAEGAKSSDVDHTTGSLTPMLAICQRPLMRVPLPLDMSPISDLKDQVRAQHQLVSLQSTAKQHNEMPGSQQPCVWPSFLFGVSPGAPPPYALPAVSGCTGDSADALNILAVPVSDRAAARAVAGLLQSLRATGFCAQVVLFHGPSLDVSLLEKPVAGLGPGLLLQLDRDATVASPADFMVAVAAHVVDVGLSRDARVLVLPPDALVQRNPFSMVRAWDGVALTLAEPTTWSVKPRCWLRWDHQLPLMANVHPWFVLAPTRAFVRFALARHALIPVRTGVALGLWEKDQTRRNRCKT